MDKPNKNTVLSKSIAPSPCVRKTDKQIGNFHLAALVSFQDYNLTQKLN